jgi:hypothetical protein
VNKILTFFGLLFTSKGRANPVSINGSEPFVPITTTTTTSTMSTANPKAFPLASPQLAQQILDLVQQGTKSPKSFPGQRLT